MKIFFIGLATLTFMSCAGQNADTTMLTEIISSQENAPVMVIFGGNPHRRHEVLQMIQQIGEITAYGTLSEEEGMEKLKSLPKVDLVLIGGRYSEEQRIRIRQYVRTNMPQTQMTEPGHDYPYQNEAISTHIKQKLGL